MSSPIDTNDVKLEVVSDAVKGELALLDVLKKVEMISPPAPTTVNRSFFHTFYDNFLYRITAWHGWRLAMKEPFFYFGSTFVLFAILITAGVIGVISATAATMADEKVRAQVIVNSVATSFGAQLIGAVFPSLAAVSFLEAGSSPTHAAVHDWFDRAAPMLVASSSAIENVQLAPYGHVCIVYPIVSARINNTGMLVKGDVGHGHDLFNASSAVANRRSVAVLALATQTLNIEGPKNLLSSSPTCLFGCALSKSSLLTRVPIFVAATSNQDTWSEGHLWDSLPNAPPLGPFTSVTDCGTIVNPANNMSLCDTNAVGDGRRFWGFFTIIVVWTELLELAQVQSLGDATSGYKWSISRSVESSNGTGTFSWVHVSSSNGALPTTAYANGCVSKVIKVYSSAWMLTVEPRSGTWLPVWTTGAVAGVVLITLLVSVLVFFLALQQHLNEDLLYSILPKRVVAKLQAGLEMSTLAESYDHVTLIFSDIVNYTKMTEQHSPEATMKMLFGIFNEFDTLTQRNQVIKFETIGDAYICVSGAPSPQDPQAQAERMVFMALDMLSVVAKHASPDGKPVEMRIGIHCGPLVAGILGKANPRWCLVGDAVNTASRMETNSERGRIHISEDLAKILFQVIRKKPDIGFVVNARGLLDIKGKGLMQTYWVEPAVIPWTEKSGRRSSVLNKLKT